MTPVEEAFNTVLQTPRASYYPIYLKQKGVNGYVDRQVYTKKKNIEREEPIYKTYNSEDAQLSGWKRYLQDLPIKKPFQCEQAKQTPISIALVILVCLTPYPKVVTLSMTLS